MTAQLDVSTEFDPKYGGSAEGIRSHYDISNDFWPHVLGSTMAYSCALFASPEESLDIAQKRKIDWHISASAANKADSVLDIGCGWGSILRPLSERRSNRTIHGITLSDAQASYLAEVSLPGVSVEVKNWAAYDAPGAYDSIISVGALEHFANSTQSPQEKIALYRDFFSRCHGWLAPGGRMSLQTIAYGNMKAENASSFMNDEIFPESELPYLHEIVEAVHGIFEVVAIRNDRLHYALTMEAWAANLVKYRREAEQSVGEQKVADMLRFFKMSSVGFRMGKQNLLRFALRPIRSSWAIQGTQDWETSFLA